MGSLLFLAELRVEESERQLRCRIRRASDGAYRWHLARCIPYTDRGDNVLRWFGTSTDVHEQRMERERLEVEVAIRTRELRQSLTEKETLLKEVAGDIHVDVSATLAAMVSLTVSDEGIGMPSGFDMKNSKSMGLPIVDILARQIGGKLKMRSQPGACFTIQFPIGAAETEIPAA